MQFVVRVLDASDALLSWARVSARAQRNGAVTHLIAKGPTRFVVTADGVASKLSIEWPDMGGIARVEPIAATPVKRDQSFNFLWSQPVWVISGEVNAPTPAVTEFGSVAIEVPTGLMGATGMR